jgi:hypothetical protein
LLRIAVVTLLNTVTERKRGLPRHGLVYVGIFRKVYFTIAEREFGEN